MQRPQAPPTQALLEYLLQQADDHALFLLSPEGLVTDWFGGAEHVFGYTSDEVVGQPVDRLFNSEDLERGAHTNELEAARVAGHSEDDRWHVRKDQSAFWGGGALYALRDRSGNLAGFAKLVRNRTDIKTEIESLENQVEALAKSISQQREFFSTIAHELRGPLAPLKNAVALLENDGTPSVRALARQMMGRQLATLQRLVDDLMELVRVGTGKIELHLEVLDLRQVANAASDSVASLAQERRQSIQRVMLGSPVLVAGDAQRLHQVFVNLLTNAIKYTPVDGAISLQVTTEGGDALVRIEDNGIGMGPEILPKVFDLFTQEHSRQPISQGGIGLGLSLVRDLVKMHGGTVHARSDGRDKGSVFTVKLPLKGTNQA
jgi:PAS domain S-box-containing protein